jgi:hypothetical protein
MIIFIIFCYILVIKKSIFGSNWEQKVSEKNGYYSYFFVTY